MATNKENSKQPKPEQSFSDDDHTMPQLPKTLTPTLSLHPRILSSKARHQVHQVGLMHTLRSAPRRLMRTEKPTLSVNKLSSRRPTNRLTSFSSAAAKSWVAWDSRGIFSKELSASFTPLATLWALAETPFVWLRGELCKINGSSMVELSPSSSLYTLSFGGCGERYVTLWCITPHFIWSIASALSRI